MRCRWDVHEHNAACRPCSTRVNSSRVNSRVCLPPVFKERRCDPLTATVLTAARGLLAALRPSTPGGGPFHVNNVVQTNFLTRCARYPTRSGSCSSLRLREQLAFGVCLPPSPSPADLCEVRGATTCACLASPRQLSVCRVFLSADLLAAHMTSL